MQRIKITPELRVKVDKFCDDLFVETRKDHFVLPKKRLENFKSSLVVGKHKQQIEFIEKIIDEYPRILKADPDEMKVLIEEFENILPKPELSRKVPNKKKKTPPFWESIVYAMRYEDLRDKEYKNFSINEGIKSCVYCNSQLALVVDYSYYNNKEKKKFKGRKARFELDHYYPKSKYPYLCATFFNLYPTCGSCNRSKSDKEVKFELYTNTDDLNVFNFWLEDESILKFLNSKNREDINIWFERLDGDLELLNKFNELFQIQGIYDTQKDVAEELILKADAYSETYKKNLSEIFNELFQDVTIVDRLLIGNYDKPEDIHKRPLAKFQQDIARQLKLIK
ncbi:MAG: hypothetical protein RBR97_09030 [Bacteroidales bacterium]|nr:hypothetical protein [Bacteroidales bacterium]